MEELKLNETSGKQAKPEYQQPKVVSSGSEPSHMSASNLTPYNANCHCGDVTYTVYTQSLAAHEVNSCNCSICTRDGFLAVFPERQEVVFHTGYDQLLTYAFGNKLITHKFCATCGSSVMSDFNGKISLGGVDQLAMNVSITAVFWLQSMD